MLLTVFLAMAFCAGITIMLISAVAFIQDNRFFFSAPKEAQEVIKPRNEELFYGARTMGWILMILSVLITSGALAVGVWDGFKNGFSFKEFFIRFILILTIYKLYDMIFFDWFVLCRFHFFQYYYPEIENVFRDRKYGFNIKSQLLKLLIIFPAVSALGAWICTLH